MNAGSRSTAAALMLLFALVSAALVAVIVPSVLHWNENGRIVRESREKVAGVEAAQRSFVRLKNATDRWTIFARSPAAGFLPAETTEEALAAAKTHMEGVVARHGGSLDAFSAEAGEPKRGQVGTVDLTVTATLRRDRMVPFLGDLEESVPYTFVGSFGVTRQNPDSVVLDLTGQMHHMMETAP